MTSATEEVVNLIPELPRQLTSQITYALTTHRKMRSERNIINQVTKLVNIGVQELPRMARPADRHHRASDQPIRIGEACIHPVTQQIVLHPRHRTLRTFEMPQLGQNFIRILGRSIKEGCYHPIILPDIQPTRNHSTSSQIIGIPAPMHLPKYSSRALVGVPSGSSR